MKETIKNKIIDKLFLILSAFIIFVIGLLITYYLVVGIKIPMPMFVFVTSLLLYNATVCGLAFKAKMVTAFRPVMLSIVILILFMEAPFIVLVFLYYLKVIAPFPSYLPYGVGMIIFAALTLFYYEKFLKWLYTKGYLKK